MILPAIGLGTGAFDGEESLRVVKDAVTREPAIGSLLKANRTLRAGLFLTSKVWPTELYFDATCEAVRQSLAAMKVNYIDLYLIHWPFCYEHLSFMDCSHSKDARWQQSYEALSKLYGEGILLNIGVSNWDEDLMTQLLGEYPIKPQIVQNHMDLANFDWEFKDFVSQHKILLQAYSTFRGIAEEEPEYAEWRNTLKTLANEIQQSQGIHVSSSQLALRFMVENNVAVIPRSSNPQHLKENNDIFQFDFTNELNLRLGGRATKQEL
ncbi:hypothetical protein RFI_12070 [Reticulomyxa filosa]|uniref:NADP-dependent oxidoreductase domain-containing protein n=1 Tax=Reticulomyxa filosa TaxID=46433 RepID=X6NH64_RETFI|nr:hypothetical protein RFI_12070 [Reticulomyxa filosa]|eukprot:ETO25074.1 hypothetical protein RFI_12070 [Reticulomyxa filosa]